MASLPELAYGVPLKVKYPSGLMRTRKFILSESIQVGKVYFILLVFFCMQRFQCLNVNRQNV